MSLTRHQLIYEHYQTQMMEKADQLCAQGLNADDVISALNDYAESLEETMDDEAKQIIHEECRKECEIALQMTIDRPTRKHDFCDKCLEFIQKLKNIKNTDSNNYSPDSAFVTTLREFCKYYQDTIMDVIDLSDRRLETTVLDNLKRLVVELANKRGVWISSFKTGNWKLEDHVVNPDYCLAEF